MATSPAVPQSEITFRNGLVAMEKRCFKESISLFQQAIEQERQEGTTKSPKMKFLSYLGYAMTLANGRSEEGLKLCEQAVKREFFDPDLFCNLGIVYLRHRQKKLAFESFDKGLRLKPNYPRITQELEKYDLRADPVFGFLPRTHPVNRLAGQLRYRIRILFNGPLGSRN